jgi:hypothetical protein
MYLFFAGALTLLAVCALIYWRWAKRVDAEIAEGAEAVWARLSANDPELMTGLDRARFGEIYRRVHFPRYPGYALAAAATFLAALPVTLALLTAGALLANRFGLTPDTAAIARRYLVEDGGMKVIRAAPPEAAVFWLQDVGGFYFFFGVVFSWMAIVFFYMRRFHQRRPGHLRDEILLRKQTP